MPTRGPRGARRAAILAAGYEAIATLGYQHATTSEICRRAGVSSGTFFHYFPTKEDLLLALITETDAPADAPNLTDLIGEALAVASDPLLPAFAREVSNVAGAPRVARALTAEQERRHAMLTTAVERERDARRLRDADTAILVLRLEVILDGFESLLVTRPELDRHLLADHVQDLITDALGWRPTP
jgi:AcrR family transcriptional regulator